MSVEGRSARRLRSRNQGLMPQQRTSMTVVNHGMRPVRMEDKSIPHIPLHTQMIPGLCPSAKANKKGRQPSKEGKPVRGRRIWVRVSRTVDPAKEGLVVAGRELTKSTHSFPPLRRNTRVCELPIIPFTVSDHSLGNVGNSAPDHIQQVVGTNENAPCGQVENRSSWKSTVSSTAKLFLRGVRESADAFGPLKSVAGGLCFILENCEVQPSSCARYPQYLPVPSEWRQTSKQ